MKNLFFAVFTLLLTPSVFSQDQVNWIMWECESNDNNPVVYVPVGHRTTLLRYETSWPSNETREVLKCRGGTCHSLGQISGGEHLLEDVYDNPMSNGYWESFPITLQVNGSSTEEATVTTTTEPGPEISAEVDLLHTTEGDSITVTASSFIEGTSGTEINTGWGLIFPFCTSHPILMIVEVSTTSDEVVFRDTIQCVPGHATNFVTGFMYKGPYTELCTEVKMKRVDISDIPTFTPREIVSADEVCMMAGGSITTGQEASREDSPFLAFPNPCHNTLFLQSSRQVTWRVTDILGSIVATGQEKEINTGSWPSGLYFLEVEGTKTFTRIVRE